MLTIRQYNKIMHDWIVLLTGLSGTNVRPQKNKFGFDLTDNNGKPIAFDSTVCMFYFGFDNNALDRLYGENDTASNLKRATLNITVVGEKCDQYIGQLQAISLGETSRNYLSDNGFSIMGEPEELNADKEYSSKWFYRRSLKITLNCALDFTPANILVGDRVINEVPLNANGIDGNIEAPTSYYNTSDATAMPNEVVMGKVFYNADGRQIGTFELLLQEKSVEPSIEEQIVLPDENYFLNKVSVGAVTSDIDQDIQPDNIKKGVDILGVVGTLSAPQLNAPSIKRTGTTVAITNPSLNGGYTKGFNIYDNGVKIGTQLVSNTSINIANFDTFGVGSHELTVTCYGEQFEESQASNVVKFSVYTITNNLTNCTTDNAATMIVSGEAYTAKITADTGFFTPTSATISMDGIEGGWYNGYNGKINIPAVVGNLVITASADTVLKLVAPILSLSGSDLTIIGPNNQEVKNAEKYILYANEAQIGEFDVPQPAYTVEEVEGATYGFELNDNGYYESTNQKKGNTFSYCKVVFGNLAETSKVTFNCINSGEANYDYGELSQLNQDLALSTADDGASGSTLVMKNFKGQSSLNVVPVVYDSVSQNDYITVKYRKDGGGDQGNDSLQFQVVVEAINVS